LRPVCASLSIKSPGIFPNPGPRRQRRQAIIFRLTASFWMQCGANDCQALTGGFRASGARISNDSQSRASAPPSGRRRGPAWSETAPRRRSERRRLALNLSLATHTPQLWLVAFVGLRSRPIGRLRPPYGVPIFARRGPLASIHLAQRPHLRASRRPLRVVGDVRQSMKKGGQSWIRRSRF
jgi:hypothetical protein